MTRNEEIKIRWENGETQAALAREFGITRARVGAIIHGRSSGGRDPKTGNPIRITNKAKPRLSLTAKQEKDNEKIVAEYTAMLKRISGT